MVAKMGLNFLNLEPHRFNPLLGFLLTRWVKCANMSILHPQFYVVGKPHVVALYSVHSRFVTRVLTQCS